MSLVEMLLGSVLLFAAASSMISVCLSNSRLRRIDSERALAFIACRNQIEEVRSLPFVTIPTLDGLGFDVPASNGGAGGLRPRDGDADGLPGQFVVTTEDSFGSQTLYRVRAVVHWEGIAGEQEFELDALIADRGAL